MKSILSKLSMAILSWNSIQSYINHSDTRSYGGNRKSEGGPSGGVVKQ